MVAPRAQTIPTAGRARRPNRHAAAILAFQVLLSEAAHRVSPARTTRRLAPGAARLAPLQPIPMPSVRPTPPHVSPAAAFLPPPPQARLRSIVSVSLATPTTTTPHAQRA